MMEDIMLDRIKSLQNINFVFFPIYNKTPLKFPIPWLWVMFPKYWKKSLALPWIYIVVKITRRQNWRGMSCLFILSFKNHLIH